MPSALQIALVALSGCVIFVLILIMRSKPGSEDKGGFHRAIDDHAKDTDQRKDAKQIDQGTALPKPTALKK